MPPPSAGLNDSPAFHRELHQATVKGSPVAVEFVEAVQGTLVGARQNPDPSYARLQLHFEKGDRLVYVNPRRLGRVSLPENAEAFIAETALGPDVLDAAFNSHAFVAILASSKRTCRRSSPSAGRARGGQSRLEELVLRRS